VASKSRKTSRRSSRDEKSRDTSPTVFTAAGLLAFSEEDAIVKINPIHVLVLTLGMIAAVIVSNAIF